MPGPMPDMVPSLERDTAMNFSLCYPGQKPQLDPDLGGKAWIQKQLGVGLFQVGSVFRNDQEVMGQREAYWTWR